MLNYRKKIKNIYYLPNLPVPEQKETMEKFLEWVKPLVTREEYEQSEILVKEFLENPLSKKLHQKLLEKAADPNSSWIIDWWLNEAYLASRGPIAPENNAAFLIDAPSIENKTPAKRIAASFYATAQLYYDFKVNGAPDYQVGKRRYSLDQLHGLFASLRIPRKNVDEYYINDELSTHGVLLFRNRMFSIQLIRDEKVVSYSEIHANIENILNSSYEAEEINANLLSFSHNRNEAAHLHNELMKEAANQQSHQEIKDAILAICYDEISVDNLPARIKNAFINQKTANRWHGKGIQLIFTQDNPIAFISDHTFVDGGTQAYYIAQMNKIMSDLDLEKKANIESTPNELSFKLYPSQKSYLQSIKQDYLSYLDSLTMKLLEMPYLTRESLRQVGILSADGFFHLALQLAQKRTFNKLYNTYIAVDIRTFFRGRTECLRPISNQSVQFINEFEKGNHSLETYNQMIATLDEHYNRAKDCQAGQGVNRYLFGLHQAYLELPSEEKEAHPFFLLDDKGFKVIRSNHVSTSSVPLPYINKLAFQPVDSEGFGISYAVGENSYVLATSFKKNEHVLKELLSQLEISISELLDFAQEMKNASSSSL